jgi:hypothetical protein
VEAGSTAQGAKADMKGAFMTKEQIILIIEALRDFEPSDEYIRLYGHPKREIVEQIIKELTKEKDA